jgi:hypothetical protein
MNLKEEKKKQENKTLVPFLWSTLKHKSLLMAYLLRFCAKLIWRGVIHDYSKFTLFEGRSYGKYLPEFKKAKYGTKEYDAILVKFQPAIDHHYARNRHHPQHYTEGYTGMNLLDLTEMFFDWKVASMKKIGTGSLDKSLLINAKRFNMSEDIVKIMNNSLDL